MNNDKIIKRLDNLRKLRKQKNITQIKLSTDLEVSQELISRYELGTSFPQPQMLIKLANYFSCSVDYLLGITDVSTPTNYLANNYNKHDLELINKYHSLSSEDKKCFDKFLLFLTDNSSAE